jgi:hypothetical protein
MIVGLRGLAGCGKTTIADLLVQRANERRLHFRACLPVFSRRSMAAPLKEALACMGLSKEGTPDLYRLVAQVVGTDLIRTARPDHWVDLFRAGKHEGVAVVDDIRFENEAACCHLVAFVEPGFPARAAGMNGRTEHQSEDWNRRKAGRLDVVVANPSGNPGAAVDQLLGIIVSRLEGWDGKEAQDPERGGAGTGAGHAG